MRTFEEYLMKNRLVNVIDFSLRAQLGVNGIEFYIHPANQDEDTIDFRVQGNLLVTKTELIPEEEAGCIRIQNG